MTLKIGEDRTINAIDLLTHLKGTRIRLPKIKHVIEISNRINGILELGYEGAVGISFYSVIFKLKITVDGILEGVEYFGKINKDVLTEDSKLKLKEEIFNLDENIPLNVTKIIEVPKYSKKRIIGVQLQLPIEIEGEYHISSLGPYMEIKIGDEKIDGYDPNF